MTLAMAPAGSLLLDYSFARASLIPQLPGARAQGYLGAVRYLSGIVEKDIDAAERDAYVAAGMGLAAVWQTSGRPDQSGAAGGRAHCAAAINQWAALGAPPGSVIFWTCDSNAVSWAQVEPYAAAWAATARDLGSVFGTGAYGPSRVIQGAHDEGLAEFMWQPETWWDTEPRRADVHLIQQVNSRKATWGGANVDENTVWQPIPLWFPGGAPLDLQHLSPASTTTTAEDDMTRAFVSPDNSLVLVSGNTYRVAAGAWPDVHQGIVDLIAAGLATEHAPGVAWKPITAAALALLQRIDTPAVPAPPAAADIATQIINQLRRPS